MNFQMKQTVVRSFITLIISLVLAAVLNSQYSPQQRLTLFFLNKTVGNLALILIGISYILGPLCIVLPKLARHLSYRRFFGVGGFIAVVLHIILSLLQWSTRFPFAWYVSNRVGITFAIMAAFIFATLAFTSKNSIIAYIGSTRWKMLQRVGYVAIVFALIHIFVVGSTRWQQWLAGEVAMPNSFVAFCVGITVIVVRIVAFIFDSTKNRRT